jgi:hypothetical protein
MGMNDDTKFRARKGNRHLWAVVDFGKLKPLTAIFVREQTDLHLVCVY